MADKKSAAQSVGHAVSKLRSGRPFRPAVLQDRDRGAANAGFRLTRQGTHWIRHPLPGNPRGIMIWSSDSGVQFLPVPSGIHGLGWQPCHFIN